MKVRGTGSGFFIHHAGKEVPLMDWSVINQRALARQAGVSRSTLDRIIRLGRPPTMGTAQRIAEALNVSVGRVFALLKR